MYAVFSILLLLFLMGIGIPVAWSFAGTLGFLVYIYDVNLNMLMLQGFRSLNSVVLLALPMFVMAGYLMQSGGVAKRLVDFLESLVKGRKSGLGTAMVLSCAMFGAIAGTASAAVASIGSILIDPMEKQGYSRGYSAALLGISSLLGILIPPSITMILFAVVTQQSVAACFAASIGPGILLMIGLIILNYFSVKRWSKEQGVKQVEATLKIENKEVVKNFLFAIPALTMPIIILGGIYGGIFTPTEAAAVTVVLAIIIGKFLYRDLTLKKLGSSLINSTETTGIIILILLFSFLISRIFVVQGIPQDLTHYVTGIVEQPIVILLLVNLFLILVGMIIDDVSLTVVIAPLFLPLVGVADVSGIHYAAIVACSVVVAANSPPLAPILYMSCRIGRVNVHKSFLPSIKMIVFVALPVLLITTFIPDVSLFIPRLLGLL